MTSRVSVKCIQAINAVHGALASHVGGYFAGGTDIYWTWVSVCIIWSGLTESKSAHSVSEIYPHTEPWPLNFGLVIVLSLPKQKGTVTLSESQM